MRKAAPGPMAPRTASRRCRSSLKQSGLSATFTLAVCMPAPTAASARASASPGPRAAIVVLTGIWWRLGSGTPWSASGFVAWLRALASHLALWLSGWFQNGAHSPQPAGPCTRTPSRTVIPRKRTRMAIEKTSTRSMLSHSAAAGGGHCLRIVSSMAPIIP